MPSATTRWLQASTVPARRGRGGRGPLLEQRADALQRQPGQVPLAHQPELLRVTQGVEGASGNARRLVDEPGLDVIAGRAAWQLGQRGDFFQGECLGVLHGGFRRHRRWQNNGHVKARQR